MKGWYNANGCTPVYCSKRNTEIAWLHCKQCEDDKPCAASADLEADEEQKIKGLEHLKLECFVEDREIIWKRLLIDCS